MADTFRARLAQAIARCSGGDGFCLDDADAVLASDDMQAIRAFIRADELTWCCRECWLASLSGTRMDGTTSSAALPQHIIDWVMDDD